MSGINQGSYRNVKVTTSTIVSSAISTPAAPVDFYVAVAEYVREYEYRWNRRREDADVPNVTNLAIVLGDRSPYNVYKATLTTVMADGSYSFTYTGTASSASA